MTRSRCLPRPPAVCGPGDPTPPSLAGGCERSRGGHGTQWPGLGGLSPGREGSRLPGAWNKDPPPSSPEPGPDRSREQQLRPPLCCHQRWRPIGAAFRRGEREGGKREPNRKDLVVTVGAGGGASSGALNFQAPSCQSLLAPQLPVPPSLHRKPTPVPGPHRVARTVSPGERRVPGVGTTGRRRPRLTCRESSVLLALRRPPSLPRPLCRPRKPVCGFKEPITPKA